MWQIQWQIDLAAAAIAIAALYISVRYSRRQTELELENLRQTRDSDIIGWSEAAVDACCRAEILLRPEYAAISDEHEFELERFQTLTALSSSIDKGRLYFPNIDADKYGLHKETAFQGSRHAVLDQLVGVYDVLNGVTHKLSDQHTRGKARERVVAYKREFLSIVHSEVDEKRRVHFLGKQS